MFESKPIIYTELQSQFTLDDNDRATLRTERGFLDSTIDLLGFKTPKPENGTLIKAAIAKYGLGECLAAGLCDIHGEPAWQFTNPAKTPGSILIPYLQADAKSVYLYKCHKYGNLNHAATLPYCEFIFNNMAGTQVILCESEFKAAAMWQMGYKALGLGGITAFSSKHIDKLIQSVYSGKPDQIIILFDNEVQDDPKLKSYKPDYRGRYQNIVWAYVMARRIDKIMNADHDPLKGDKPAIDIRVATLTMDMDLKGTGKVDVDSAVANGFGRKHFDKILLDSMPAETYRDYVQVPEIHRGYVLRAMAKAVKSDFLSEMGNCYWTKVKKQTGKIVTYIDKKLSNFVIEVKASLNKEGDVSREFQLKSEFGETSSVFVMKGTDMSSFSKFREACLCRGDFLWKGNEEDWNLVIEDLFYETDVNVIQILKMIGRNESRKFWVFDNIIIDDDRKEYFPIEDGVTFKLADNHYRIEPISDAPLPSLWLKEIDIEEVFTKFTEAWGMEGAMGYAWMIGNLFSNHVFDKYQLFPFLMLYGEKGSGKSALSDALMALAGFPASTPAMNISETTQVAIARKLAFYHSLPLRLDELRQGDQKTSQKTSAFRSFYNRQGASKGLRDNYGVREIVIKGTAMIIGEQRVDDVALNTRCIPLELNPRNKSLKSYEAMQWLYEHAKEISYVSYALLKDYQANAKEFMTSLEATRKSLSKLSTTMSDTRTQVHFAMMMAALGLKKQPEKILELQRSLLAMFTRVAKEIDERTALNIFFEEVVVMANLNEVPPGLISRDFTNDKKGYMAFYEVFETWSKFKQQRGANMGRFDKATMINYLKLQPYFNNMGVQRSVKIGDTARRFRFVEFDLANAECPELIRNLFEMFETRAYDAQ